MLVNRAHRLDLKAPNYPGAERNPQRTVVNKEVEVQTLLRRFVKDGYAAYFEHACRLVDPIAMLLAGVDALSQSWKCILQDLPKDLPSSLCASVEGGCVETLPEAPVLREAAGLEWAREGTTLPCSVIVGAPDEAAAALDNPGLHRLCEGGSLVLRVTHGLLRKLSMGVIQLLRFFGGAEVIRPATSSPLLSAVFLVFTAYRPRGEDQEEEGCAWTSVTWSLHVGRVADELKLSQLRWQSAALDVARLLVERFPGASRQTLRGVLAKVQRDPGLREYGTALR
jgi:hypothetical protein